MDIITPQNISVSMDNPHLIVTEPPTIVLHTYVCEADATFSEFQEFPVI